MAESYELYLNGEQYDEVWMNGLEYTEAWALVDGVPTKVWGKGTSILEGGFYNSDGVLVMKWGTTYTMQNSSGTVQFNIPNALSYSIPTYLCTALGSTLSYLDSSSYTDKPMEFSDIYKIVIPSEVTQVYSFIEYSNSSKSNLREVLFNDREDTLTLNCSIIVNNAPNLQKINFPKLNIVKSNARFLYYCGNNTDGMTVDATELEAIPSQAFQYCKIKKIVISDKLTSLGEGVFDYVNRETDCYMEKIYFPNVKTYSRLGYYAQFEEVEFPKGSTLNQYCTASSNKIKKIKIGDECILKNGAISYIQELEELYIGKDVVFGEGCIRTESQNCKILFDDDIENFNLQRGSSSYVFIQTRYSIVRLPSKLKTIPSQMFVFYNSTSFNIPSSLMKIEPYGIVEIDSSCSAHFENPNGWVVRDASGNIKDVGDLSDDTNARTMISTYNWCTWTREG